LLINDSLVKNLPQAGPALVLEAMRYSIEAGGKRLRPVLVIAVAETMGLEDDSIVDLASSLEYIHTYSLIHDDLPAMDNSDLRRGKPTCHRVYGEAIAILAGDALLTLAFETAAKYGKQNGKTENALRIIKELAVASGTAGMVGGQVLDLEAEKIKPELAQINGISEMKTGALLKAAVLCGAIAAGAAESEEKALTVYAENIGIAYQIVDDLLDCESTVEILGKPTGADRARSKATYPAVLGIEEAKKRAEDLYSRSITALGDINRPTDLLESLAKKMVFRKM
jgi:geranylgeranyl diphosphate synthase, type II